MSAMKEPPASAWVTVDNPIAGLFPEEEEPARVTATRQKSGSLWEIRLGPILDSDPLGLSRVTIRRSWNYIAKRLNPEIYTVLGDGISKTPVTQPHTPPAKVTRSEAVAMLLEEHEYWGGLAAEAAQKVAVAQAEVDRLEREVAELDDTEN